MSTKAIDYKNGPQLLNKIPSKDHRLCSKTTTTTSYLYYNPLQSEQVTKGAIPTMQEKNLNDNLCTPTLANTVW